jgi:3-methyl-2-oxobutanoate hydroxymethyltransferase
LVKKKGKEKIVMLTAYDYPTAKILSQTELDAILVGDSAGMNVLGYSSTLSVTMEEMEIFVKAVARANPPQLVIADMPFLSYEVSIEKAVENAGKLIRAGGEAVKIEGGREVVDVVRALVRAGIPVLGHIGLTPQRVLKIGGYKLMGKQEEVLVEDAAELEKAGAFGIVIENTYAEVAKRVTETVKIPTICIGSGPYCDGQVLVIHDVIGLSEVRPYFSKTYVNLKEEILKAAKDFVKEVREGFFPSQENYRVRVKTAG